MVLPQPHTATASSEEQESLCTRTEATTMTIKRARVLVLAVLAIAVSGAEALAGGSRNAHQSESTAAKQTLKFELQQCATPHDVLQKVASKLSPQTDPDGSVASLVLVRLSKQIISLDNQLRANPTTDHDWRGDLLNYEKAWRNACSALALALVPDMHPSMLESSVEGLKAASTLSRLLPASAAVWSPLLATWDQQSPMMHDKLASHQMTGIKWAYDTFSLQTNEASLPPLLQGRYNSFNIPFRIIPACLEEVPDLSVARLVQQVDFRVDAIRTTSNQVVPERRQTAWEGDADVPPFEYSGKSMPTRAWSPLVEAVRDGLFAKTGQYYDGCLLNLYPDGGSGMRYHSDPDQGVLWDSATAVVSVGSTRKFAFRDIPNDTRQETPSQPHNFVVMEGDVTEMLDDCQMRFQHTVKTADDKNEVTPRASLVFKRTLTKKCAHD